MAFLRRHWLLLCILALGAAIRLYAFGSNPPGLHQDEAATSYDAFALLRYGIDRTGFHNPVMFVSWGSGMYALPGYLMMPFYLLFGVTVSAARSVNLVFGLLSLVAFYGLTRRIVDEKFALLATFLLAINPWHIMISRWALDSNIFPALFLFAVFFLVRGLEHPRSLLLSAVFFALSLYAYGTAYVVVPLYLLGALVYVLVYRRTPMRPSLQSALLFGVIALPIVLFLILNQCHLQSIETPLLSIPRLTSPPRYQTTSTLFHDNFWYGVTENLSGFWTMLRTQNDGLIWNAIPEYGFLYFYSLPFAFIGLVVCAVDLIRKRGRHSPYFFLLWLLTAVILAALQPVNINRMNILFLPLVFFLAFGIRYIGRTREVFLALLCLYGVSFVGFVHAYVTRYPEQAGPAFFAGLGEAIQDASRHTDGPICVTSQINQPYIFVLFYEQIDPHLFLRTVQYENPGEEFQRVASFGRYVFGIERCRERPEIQVYIIERSREREFANWMRWPYGQYAVAIPPQEGY
jgi:4-amino-4-deoxy-L-arabinose transferase-like glycosyltransferase